MCMQSSFITELFNFTLTCYLWVSSSSILNKNDAFSLNIFSMHAHFRQKGPQNCYSLEISIEKRDQNIRYYYFYHICFQVTPWFYFVLFIKHGALFNTGVTLKLIKYLKSKGFHTYQFIYFYRGAKYLVTNSFLTQVAAGRRWALLGTFVLILQLVAGNH